MLSITARVDLRSQASGLCRQTCSHSPVLVHVVIPSANPQGQPGYIAQVGGDGLRLCSTAGKRRVAWHCFFAAQGEARG